MTLDGAFAQRETRHAARWKEGQSGWVSPVMPSTARSLTPRAVRSQSRDRTFGEAPKPADCRRIALEGHILRHSVGGGGSRLPNWSAGSAGRVRERRDSVFESEGSRNLATNHNLTPPTKLLPALQETLALEQRP